MNKRNLTLSANALFHFTDELENLEGILKNEFLPKYCIEDNIIVPLQYTEGRREARAIPMVCFCDIPLSQIKNHVDYYGYYAIGLDKKWGIRSKISPVLYSYRDSLTGDFLYNSLRKVIELKGPELSALSKFGILSELLNFSNFIKPYEGKLWRKGKIREQTVRFYDEREWRYSPNIRRPAEDSGDIAFSISKEDFLNSNKLREHNKKLEKYKLLFNPKDIKYIIVKKEDERLKMAKSIETIKERNFTYDEVRLLITKIISMEQIMDDF